MKIEDIPKKVLSHTGCAVCGFLIALWCQETSAPGQNHQKFKPGFTITLKSPDENTKGEHLDNAENLVLIGQNSNDACQWEYSGTLVRRRGNHIQVMGDIDSLDSAVKIVDGIKTGLIEITTRKKAEIMPICQDLPLVTYGPHP